MQSFNVGEMYHGFRVVRSAPIPGMNATCHRLDHVQTGATLYYSDRDDHQLIFSVGFRTIPEDDTGVFHILEHSCLDGSRAYPLKEPFVNLMKTSMAVDLNAMTYQERTLYYFITTNPRDYMNMMSVYLDAVFHPLLLTDRRIFEKEAWRWEPTADGGVGYSGVVFNEMQGTENRPDAILWLEAMRCLFPDRYARFFSGGDPAAIPDLTYEAFTETYRRFYSTDNAIFYLSGRMDVDEPLAYLDGVLSSREATGYTAPPPVAPQPPVVCPESTVYYQLGDNEDTEGNTRLLLTCVMGDGRPNEELLAMSLLSRYLSESTESPLSGAVLDADVGQDFSMGCDGDCLQPLVYFSLNKSDPERAEDFRRIIVDTLTALVAEGLDQRRLQALLDNHETERRRASLRVDTGFSLMEGVIRAHVMRGDVSFPDNAELLRRRWAEDPRYFEHLLEKYILHSEHWALTRCVPSRTLGETRRRAMATRLDAEADRLHATPGGYDAMVAHARALEDYLTAEDDPAVAATVPHLTPADISPDLNARDVTVGTAAVGGAQATSLWYRADTNGMASVGLLFDLGGIPEEDLIYVRCLRETLLELPAGDMTIPQLTDRWVELRTNPDLTLLQVARGMGDTDFNYYLHLQLDAPEETLAQAVALLGAYISRPVFDPTTLRRLLANTSDIKNGMISRGNATALRLGEACLTAVGAYGHRLVGLEAYRQLFRMAEDFDGACDRLIEGMTRVSRRVWRTVPIVYAIGGDTAKGIWEEALSRLPLTCTRDAEGYTVTPVTREARALCIPGEVNYCGEVFATPADGDFYPRARVIASYLNSTYFWDEIRAKGGAYGGGITVTPHGVVAMSSYRDPRLAETYGAFERLPDWLEGHIPDGETLGSLQVSTLGSAYFLPQSPLDEGMSAVVRYLLRKTVEDRRAEVAAILDTRPEDFARFASMLRALRAQGGGVKAALGSRRAVEASDLFTAVEEL